MKSTIAVVGLAVLGSIALTKFVATASDHDDGTSDEKAQSLNLTDLYVFKESTEIADGSPDHLVFILNSNPRSLPQQQYYFSTQARYELHIDRVGTDKAAAAGTDDDIVLRFQFGEPNENKQQPVTLTVIQDGAETTLTTADTGEPILTTPLASAATPAISTVSVNGQPLELFAGLREDPFFFDVTAFFKFRGTGEGFPAQQPRDFTENYNVNAIAVKVPVAALQSEGETVFDTWATVSIPQAGGAGFTQIERLARPAINEGLVISNEFLNAFNSIPPSQDLSDAAAPVRAEALSVLNVVTGLAEGGPTAEQVAGQFLPDVMRIKTDEANSRPGSPQRGDRYVGYISCLNTAETGPLLCGGRKLRDDVMDITLNYIASGNPAQPYRITDRIDYWDAHSPVTDTFPFLAEPN